MSFLWVIKVFFNIFFFTKIKKTIKFKAYRSDYIQIGLQNILTCPNDIEQEQFGQFEEASKMAARCVRRPFLLRHFEADKTLVMSPKELSYWILIWPLIDLRNRDGPAANLCRELPFFWPDRERSWRRQW